MSTMTTPRAPSLARDTAIAFPRPQAPPVTRATPGAMGPDLLVVEVDFYSMNRSVHHMFSDIGMKMDLSPCYFLKLRKFPA
jgi:hypothetical protein